MPDGGSDPTATAAAAPPHRGRGAPALLVRCGPARGDGEHVLVGVDLIREVVDRTAVTRLPGAPAALAGVLAHRGRVLPAWSAPALLGVGSGDPSAPPPVLLHLHLEGTDLALLVDAVLGLQQIPDVVSGSRSWWAEGTAHVALRDDAVVPATVLSATALRDRVVSGHGARGVT